VAYFTSSQAIGSSANLFWDNTNGRLGIATATPGVRLDIHGTGTIQQINSTGATNNGYLAFQRAGTTTFSIGDTYNAGSNYFRIYSNTLAADVAQIFEATGKTSWQATQTYSTGLARANYFDYNLSVAAGASFSSPNAITALGASLDLTLAGNATIPSGARTGLDAYNSVSFTGAGTLTMTQGTQIRPYSNITAGWAFAGSATGTITHLAGLRVLFPDNSGSAVTVTNNYGLLINDQTANTGTVTYTNRWGIYQEGVSDLNYFAANMLLGSTVNNGNKLQVTGNGNLTGDMTADAYYLNGMTAGNGALYWSSDRVTLANYNASGTVVIETGGGITALTLAANQAATFVSSVTSNSSFISQTAFGGTFRATDGTNEVRFGSYFNTIGAGNSYDGVIYTTNVSSSMSFLTGGSTTAKMIVTSGGNIGINTLTPNSKLSIGGSGYNGRAITAIANNNDYAITFQQDNASGGGLQMFSTAATFGADIIRISDATTTQINLKNNGNFLIGTTTDAGQKLQVSGSAYISSTLAVNNVISANGIYNTTGTVVAAGSSTTTIYSIPNDSINKIYLVTVRQQGSGTNNLMGMAFAQTTSCTATRIAFNSTLSMDIQCTGNNIELVLGAGFGTTTWEYTITIIKNV
jgi:hypothetical protein